MPDLWFATAAMGGIMKRLLSYWIVCVVGAGGFLALMTAVASGADGSAWDHATNFETRERFIPVELWAGAEWNGRRELEMPTVDGHYRHNKATYSIKGPMEWKHPSTGQIHLGYERINPQKGGPKLQIFTINEERTGLGRLYDGRPGRDLRTSSGGLKFPLGTWKEGETRRFAYKVYEGSRDSVRVESITIKQIDFAMGRDKRCLELYWTVTDKDEKKLYDHHTYSYCPGKSMVHEIQH
jgi:hypothetical protein